MRLRVGSMFSGYEGIGLALAEVFGDVEHLFVADVCKHTKTKDGHEVGHHEPHRAPCSILAHRFPGVPNLGDVSLIDWTPWRGLIEVLPPTSGSVGSVLPTPRASRGASSTETVAMLLPSPRTSDTNGAGHHGDGGMDLRTAVSEIALLPTPAVNDMGAAYTPETWDEWTAEMKAKHNNGNGHGKSLNVEAQRLLPTPMANEAEKAIQGPRLSDGQKYLSNVIHELLPTPRATDGTKGGPNQRGSSGDLMLPSAVSSLLPTPTAADSKSSGASGYDSGHDGTTLTDATVRQPARWGEYEPAIRRWESVTRPAPEPTKANSKGNPKLSDLFDEWLMGLPAGWITDVPGVTWNEALKACGNGVVPQQAAAALRHLWRMSRAVA